jgi:hypothetical protein
VSGLLLIVLAAVVALTALWAGLALWFRIPASEFARVLSASLFALLGFATVIAIFSRYRRLAMIGYAVVFASLLIWWSSIKPAADADWSPDVSRQVTGTTDGDQLTLTGVRNFKWRSESDFTEAWMTRSYDLTKLSSLDLFMSYWAGPEMAHVIMSFGFDGGDHLAWSIEVRRRAGGAFSPIADLFKSNPLVIVAADERDVVGLRSNIRREDVQLYRLNVSPAAARALLLEYVADANELSAKPQFYNSLTTNCTTTIWKMMRAVGDVAPFDWRLIVNGYLPEYAYMRGALTTGLTLQALKAAAHIDKRAQAAGLSSPDFSRAIRVGVPSPTQATH